ncbi:MAG: zinc-binding dehydrogenase [Muribaculaceae bacterium]|nr:zinc-binding dehydrogenase [Muribaculaceae bacterium]MCM1459612.1 zinc-binding dehydrogenase [Bacteroides sp.]
MQAVILTKPTKAETVTLTDAAMPQVRAGWVLVKIKAFGMNHSEQILRLSEIKADYISKPVIPGIECVGEIVHPSDSDFKKGQRVVALMGGMGRSFNGSYAEFTLLPAHHVFAINDRIYSELNLSWAELAAIPETYFTAWGSLFECLDLKREDTLFVRGGTCALGYAAITLAKALGCRVIASTHKESKMELLQEADDVVLDRGHLAETLSGVNKVLELVGVKTLSDSLRCVNKGGIVCNTGVLGGVFALSSFDPIKFIPNGVYLTGFYSNNPTQQAFDDIFSFIAEHRIKPCVGKQFDFSEIRDAYIALDSGSVNGKIVVKVEGE